MKTLVATILLALSVSPAFAGSVYQTVSAQRVTDTHSMSAPGGFHYTPLYRQVTGEGMRTVDHIKVKVNPDTEFTYTPLYLKVTGRMG
jgi:hypothetical protein